MLESILNFILSFLKLSTNKILIGLLSMAVVFLIWQNHNITQTMEQVRITNQIEKDTLRSIILNRAIRAQERELKMMQDCYEEKENTSKQIEKLQKSKKR